MHTVELLETALATAERLGYHVRHEWLGGAGGGVCRFSGRKWLFVDLALSTPDQLDQAVGALRGDPAVHVIECPAELGSLLDQRKAA